jgi:nitroimidazol reductase NimA-like FMN-containing flavoprotein (pyridoxamine 5'-phosphate oxidase superfamily)
MPATLTKDEIQAYLDSKPGWIILTTVGRDGMPHTIPIGYFRSGDEIYIGCRTGTQKLKNIERNPNVSLLVQSGGSMQDIKGVMIQGTASAITEPVEFLRLSREAARWRGTPEAQWPTEPRPGAAYIRVEPKKYISWDYSRP